MKHTVRMAPDICSTWAATGMVDISTSFTQCTVRGEEGEATLGLIITPLDAPLQEKGLACRGESRSRTIQLLCALTGCKEWAHADWLLPVSCQEFIVCYVASASALLLLAFDL